MGDALIPSKWPLRESRINAKMNDWESQMANYRSVSNHRCHRDQSSSDSQSQMLRPAYLKEELSTRSHKSLFL
jgi:hypothetical protein